MLETEVKFLIDQHSVGVTDTLARCRLQPRLAYIKDEIWGYKDLPKARLRTIRAKTLNRYVVEVKERLKDEADALKREIETVLFDGKRRNGALKAISLFGHGQYSAESSYEKYRWTYNAEGAVITEDIYPFGVYLEIEGEPNMIERWINILGLNKEDAISSGADELYQSWCKENGLQEMYDVRFGHPYTVPRKKNDLGVYIDKGIWGG